MHETPSDLRTKAKSLHARCRGASRAACDAQGSDEAQHQAGQAQRALDELVELLDEETPYEETEALESEAYFLTEAAFDAVCAIRAAEKLAQKSGTTPAQRPGNQEELAAELDEEAERPTPAGLLEIAKPHVEEAREFIRKVREEDEAEDHVELHDTSGDPEPSCKECDDLGCSTCEPNEYDEPTDRVDRIAATQKWDPENDPYTAGRIVEHKSKSGKTTQRAVIEENHQPGNPRGRLTCVRLSTTGILIPQHVYLRKQEATLVPETEKEAK